MTHRTHGIRKVRRWHARVGIIALLFLMLLVFSGIALNHADALGLDAMEIKEGWLLNWYGLKAAAPAQGYRVGGGFFAWDGDKWALEDKALAGAVASPVGAVEVDGVIYIATHSGLYLFRPGGALVDRIEGSALPATSIFRLGTSGDGVVVESDTGVFASRDGIDWRRAGGGAVVWSALQTIPAETRRKLAPLLAPGLPAQRILQDIHSGRLFGRHGPLFVDLLACALLGLGLSGLWMYWRVLRR